MKQKTQQSYASFDRRLLAYGADLCILTTLLLACQFIAGISPYHFYMTSSQVEFEQLGTIASASWVTIVSIILPIAYFMIQWQKNGQTIGKKIMGLRIITKDNTSFTWLRVFLRYVGYVLSQILLYLPFLFILYDKDKRGIHDIMANTYVVEESAPNKFLGLLLFFGWVGYTLLTTLMVAGKALMFIL